MTDGRSDSDSNPEYPDALAQTENAFLQRRHANLELDGVDARSRLGVGISGGGIRSATFALGFFQALARQDCTKHIDYLSTVSGGGYFGGFFGALFRRDNVRNHADVKDVLDPEKQTDVLHYLRENGSYLAPAGNDSLLLGAATLFRNWCVVQLLFIAALFGGFFALQVVTRLAQLSDPLSTAAALVPIWREPARWGVPLSPWFAITVLMSAFWVAPLTWSYWVIGRDVPRFLRGPTRAVVKVIWTVLLHVAAAAAGFSLMAQVDNFSEQGLLLAGISGFALSIGLIALLGNATWAPGFALAGAFAPLVLCAAQLDWSLWWAFGACSVATALTVVLLVRELRTGSAVAHASAGTLEPQGVRELDEDNEGRYELSNALKVALVCTYAVLALAVIDTGARYLVEHASNLVKGGLGFGTVVAIASSVLRRGWALFANPPGKAARPALSVTLIAGVAASVIVICLLLACDAGAYWLVQDLAATTLDVAVRDATAFVQHCVLVLAALIALNLILGSSRNLLNASTQLPLYSARLIRAYLGASNPKRTQHAEPSGPANDVVRKGESDRPQASSLANERRSREIGAGTPSPAAATRVMDGDDIPAQSYWRWDNELEAASPQQADPYAKGAPLHLVNVTINETVDGRSQIQQGDRKGLGLAVGPGGFSVGIRHHAVFFDKQRHSFPRQGWRVFRFEGDAPEATGISTMRKLLDRVGPTHWLNRRHILENFPFDRLSFGQWLGISGAAFSTGLGSRTNLGISVLAALANVRLGFWWRPGIKTSVAWLHRVGALFWVQTYLFRELLARFPGTSRALWYLSDGGHFENLAGYELVRRRLPYVLLIDSEEDPDYQCESLANLVRKARLDFGAEIEFFEQPAHSFAERHQWPAFTGALADLQRGSWSQEGGAGTPVWKLTAAESGGLSRAHAALAQITYRDGTRGWLLYVKPTLIGEEPQDVRNYHMSHPAFPHEPTTDQFFDEAQWESYRFLGQKIAERLLAHDGVLQKFFDRDLSKSEDGRAHTTSSKPVPKTDAA